VLVVPRESGRLDDMAGSMIFYVNIEFHINELSFEKTTQVQSTLAPCETSILPLEANVSTDSPFASFAEISSMWQSFLRIISRSLYSNTSPFQKSVGNSLDVRLLVQVQESKLIACLAALIKDLGVIASVMVPAYDD
jgi:hypothetical protein